MSQPEANPPADFMVSLPDSWRAAVEQRGSPAERIAVIADSLRCFTYGWLSCLPVIGVAYLYLSVRRFVQVRRRQAEWNPARGYLAAGLALASVGWVAMLVSWLVLLNAVVVVGELSSPDASVMNLLPNVLLFGNPPALALLMLAGLTLFPSLELKLRSEQFARELRQYRTRLIVLGCAWLVWLSRLRH